MSIPDASLSKDSTIYSYTLLKRIHHTIYKIVIYMIFLVLVLLYQVKYMDWIPVVCSYPVLIIAHFLLVRIYFQFTVGRAMRGWAFKWGVFWCGILPEGNASIKLVSKVQLQLFWIGFTSLLLLYPWIPGTWFRCLIVFHLWMMMPRLWMLFRFRPYRKNGLIKITGKDTSCYLQ
ncbi:hypothetical protein [Paenibacillus aestuarii]|uniref:Transposase n=1 Tax=Paenibacillus aestuarii TaxID=516965 RepID=A0ABW0KJ82_9BACL|nr:hypothetical protein [Paenibacillus aestuarii]